MRFSSIRLNARWSRLALLAITVTGCASAASSPSSGPAPAGRSSPVVARVRIAEVPALINASPSTVGMDPALPAKLDSIIRIGIAEGASPGAVVAVGRYGRLVHLRGYGTLDYAADSPPADGSSLYDLASLTKVVATTTIAMILEDQGKLDLKRAVHLYLPEFNAPDKDPITVEMLLTHSGGLEAGAPLYLKYRGRAEYIAQINARPLKNPPGTAAVYSDWDMVLLQAVIERITGEPLDQLATEKIFRPLGMLDTQFNPDTSNTALRRRIAPTLVDTTRGGLLQGIVHDGNAWALGGVSGHAGLFSSARDLATFSQFMLDGGSYNGVRIIAPTTVARWTNRQSILSSRDLGWDSPSASSSAGRFFGPRSFGHTGFTGTSIWIDPERGLFVVLLTNRVNSHGLSNRHVQLRRDVADAVQSSILDAPLIDWEVRR